MPPQTPATNGASSTDGETPRSTLVIPTRAERTRKQKQEAFNARVEESLQQRVKETGQQRQKRRLPKAVTVSSLLFAIVVVTSNVYSFVEFSRSLSLAPKRSLQAAGKREGVGAGN